MAAPGGTHRELTRTARDRVGDVQVREADECSVCVAGEQVDRRLVAAVAQVQQHVLGQRSGAVGLGHGGHQLHHLSDLGLVQPRTPRQLAHPTDPTHAR